MLLALFSIALVTSLPFSTVYDGNLNAGGISLSYDEYGNIFNVSFNNHNLIKEINFKEVNKGIWKYTTFGLFFTNQNFKLEINKAGIIRIMGTINYSIEFFENINISRAITFNGIIVNGGDLIIRFNGNFSIDNDEISASSPSTFFFNTTTLGPVFQELSGPSIGGIFIFNKNYTYQYVYVNYSSNLDNMKFYFNFSGMDKYFIFYFANSTGNFQIILNGKIYSNFTTLRMGNYTVYSILMPSGNNTLEFRNAQANGLQDILAISIILVSIIIGIIMLMVVRKK